MTHAAALAVVVTAVLPLLLASAFRAQAGARPFLTAWAEDEGMTPLRCRLYGVVPRFKPDDPVRVVYRLTAIDRRGRLWTALVSVAGKFVAGDFIPKGVSARRVRVRETPRGALAAPGPQSDPLWDREVDG